MNSKVGHYEILEKLGEGGMGIVYKARDIRLDRTVALKVLPDDQADRGWRNRLVREARAASSLNHPNIVTIYDVDVADGVQLIAMEFISGRSLAEMVRPGGLPLREVLGYGVQIAEAAGKAHSAGVIHRDLKPANIMVTEDGLVKILDFGLAKKYTLPEADGAATIAAPMTTPGLILGTVAYMSPEQALGEPVDGRSDIFSLGVILYELLSGVRPFTGHTMLVTLQKIQIEIPPPLKTARPDLPDAVDRVIGKALEKDRTKRYRDMHEMRSELLQVMEGISQHVRLEAAPHHQVEKLNSGPSGSVRKYRYIFIAAIFALIAFIAFIENWIPRFYVSREQTGFVEPSSVPAEALSSAEWSAQSAAWIKRYDKPENIDRAIEAAKKAIERDSGNAMGYASLAEGYYRKNAVAPDVQWMRLAAESARKAVELNPDLAAAHLANGIVLLNTGQPTAAHDAFERARTLDPLSALAQMWLAEYYSQQNDVPRAEQFYKRAIELAPMSWMPHLYWGTFLYKHARYTEAVDAFESARILAPDNVSVLRNLAGAYHMLDNYEEAATVLQRALEVRPTAGIYANLGTARFFQGRYSDSAEAFEKAVQMNPTQYLYWGNLGDAHRWIPGNEAKANQAYGRGIALLLEKLMEAPNDADLRATLAMYYAKSGDRPHSLQELTALETLPKRTPGSYFKALLAHELTRNREKALQALEEAIRAGYSVQEIKTEPELTSLRADRRYHEIIAAAAAAGRCNGC